MQIDNSPFVFHIVSADVKRLMPLLSDNPDFGEIRRGLVALAAEETNGDPVSRVEKLFNLLTPDEQASFLRVALED